jgi:hypothetical protein
MATDPRTPARETSLLAQEAPEAAGKLYLGDPAVVDRLVRDFVGGVWNRTTEVSEGTLGRPEGIAANEAAAKAFMEVIAGRDPAYVPMGGWNANETGGLKSFIRRNLEEIMHPDMMAKPDGPYEALAAYLMHETYRLLAEMSDLPEEAVQGRLDGILDDGRRLLLGLPSNQELDDLEPDPDGAPAAA